MQVDFDRAMLLVQRQCPDHSWQRFDERAIDGNRSSLQCLEAAILLCQVDSLLQLLQDGVHQFGIEHAAGLGEAAEAEPL